MTTEVLGILKDSLSNWVRLSERGQFGGAGERPVRPEQMELTRLRAELARVKMERDTEKKAAVYFAQDVPQSTPESGRSKHAGRRA